MGRGVGPDQLVQRRQRHEDVAEAQIGRRWRLRRAAPHTGVAAFEHWGAIGDHHHGDLDSRVVRLLQQRYRDREGETGQNGNPAQAEPLPAFQQLPPGKAAAGRDNGAYSGTCTGAWRGAGWRCGREDAGTQRLRDRRAIPSAIEQAMFQDPLGCQRIASRQSGRPLACVLGQAASDPVVEQTLLRRRQRGGVSPAVRQGSQHRLVHVFGRLAILR